MEKESRKIRLVKRLKAATVAFSGTSVIWLLLMLVVTLFDVFYNGATHEFPKNTAGIMLWSWLNDVVFWLSLLLKLYIIFTILYLISIRLANIIFRVFIGVAVFLQLALVMYFNKTLLPLGADLYGYSMADIRQTLGASGGVNLALIVIFIVTIAIIVTVLKLYTGKIKPTFAAAVILPIVSLFMYIVNAGQSGLAFNLGSDYANNLAINKFGFFYHSSAEHFFPDEDSVDIYADSYIGDYIGKKSSAVSFNYVDETNYPLLHTDSTRDVLSPFFKPSTTPPNIVIILVEGLGRAFTNDGAYLGSFTPFIDSLSGKSLYWRNFLSEGGRTFAVLPSLLGSLPFARNGFLELGNQMPPHLSLLNLLKFNGYHTSFYYGGAASFDNMELFLEKNKVDEINDENSFPAGYQKIPPTNGFTWGYNDKELFRHFLATRDPAQRKAPQLSVILTVSTHDPFKLNEQDAYLKRFEQRMTALGFDEAKKSEHRNYKYQYASILYMDDAIRKFISDYSKRADYGNTIFLITGDHRMPEIPMSDKIDRYHVPLIVYSPLLKRTSQISSVSTHFDIAPSLLAYLKHNFKIKTPSLVSWMGQGLDTNAAFRNIHQYPLMQTKNDLLDYIGDDYHLNGNSLFKLSPDLSEQPVTDDEKLNQLKNGFEQFKKRNTRLVNGAKLIPDTIYRHYNPAK